jgi:hypothetical protein
MTQKELIQELGGIYDYLENKGQIFGLGQIDDLLAKIKSEGIKQLNDLPDKRSELLRFFLWFRENGDTYIDKSIENMIDIYLTEKS